MYHIKDFGRQDSGMAPIQAEIWLARMQEEGHRIRPTSICGDNSSFQILYEDLGKE